MMRIQYWYSTGTGGPCWSVQASTQSLYFDPPNGLISCHPGILIVLCPGSEKHHQHCWAAKRSHKLKCISNDMRNTLFLGWTHLTPSSSLFAGPALALVRQLITSLNFDTILRTVCNLYSCTVELSDYIRCGLCSSILSEK